MEDIAELVGGVDDCGTAVAEDARLLHTQDWAQIQCCLGPKIRPHSTEGDDLKDDICWS